MGEYNKAPLPANAEPIVAALPGPVVVAYDASLGEGDFSPGEISSSLVNALSVAIGDKHPVLAAPYSKLLEAGSKAAYAAPGILIVLDSSGSDYPEGVRFLRRYWAGLVGNDKGSPPVVYLSFNKLQDLIRGDLRQFVLCTQGVDLAQPPFSLKDVSSLISRNFGKSIPLKIVAEQLKKSCDLKTEGLTDHVKRNFMAQYLLMSGANAVGDVEKDDFSHLVSLLNSSSAEEEIGIYFSLIKKSPGIGAGKGGGRLQDILRGKNVRVLLIDDESRKYSDTKYCGWTYPLSKMLGADDNPVAVGEKWATADEILVWNAESEKYEIRYEPLSAALTIPTNRHLLNYDLILLDLYLAKDDEVKQNGKSDQWNKYSGLKVLEKVRDIDPSVPVILFTASGKAFNVHEAEEIGIQGYFQKATTHHDKVAEEYYKEFRELLLGALDWRKRAVRELMRAFAEYRATHPQLNLQFQDKRGRPKSASTEDESALPALHADMVTLLGPALSSLSMFLEKKSDPHLLTAAAILAGQALEVLYQVTSNKYCKCDPKYLYDSLYISGAGLRPTPIEISCFMAKQNRNSAAHVDAGGICFADVYFMLYTVLAALGVAMQFVWGEKQESVAITDVAATAKEIVDSVCACACPLKSNRRACCVYHNDVPGVLCGGTEPVLNRAMYLSFKQNIKSDEARRIQTLFQYSLYVLALNKRLEKADGEAGIWLAVSSLINARLKQHETIEIKTL